MTKQQAVIDREQMRIALAAFFMAAEISAARGIIDENSELAARALRRADMLLERHERAAEPPA